MAQAHAQSMAPPPVQMAVSTAPPPVVFIPQQMVQHYTPAPMPSHPAPVAAAAPQPAAQAPSASDPDSVRSTEPIRSPTARAPQKGAWWQLRAASAVVEALQRHERNLGRVQIGAQSSARLRRRTRSTASTGAVGSRRVSLSLAVALTPSAAEHATGSRSNLMALPVVARCARRDSLPKDRRVTPPLQSALAKACPCPPALRCRRRVRRARARAAAGATRSRHARIARRRAAQPAACPGGASDGRSRHHGRRCVSACRHRRRAPREGASLPLVFLCVSLE
jgi:hypothetical protein